MSRATPRATPPRPPWHDSPLFSCSRRNPNPLAATSGASPRERGVPVVAHDALPQKGGIGREQAVDERHGSVHGAAHVREDGDDRIPVPRCTRSRSLPAQDRPAVVRWLVSVLWSPDFVLDVSYADGAPADHAAGRRHAWRTIDARAHRGRDADERSDLRSDFRGRDCDVVLRGEDPPTTQNRSAIQDCSLIRPSEMNLTVGPVLCYCCACAPSCPPREDDVAARVSVDVGPLVGPWCEDDTLRPARFGPAGFRPAARYCGLAFPPEGIANEFLPLSFRSSDAPTLLNDSFSRNAFPGDTRPSYVVDTPV